MNKLPAPNQQKTRTILRIAGLLIAATGLLFTITGVVSFFSAFGGFEPPRFFWCCFVGLPLLFLGVTLCMLGFMGAVTRYMAAEQLPVAMDAMNDLAEGTQDAVKTTARAVAAGVKEGLQGPKP